MNIITIIIVISYILFLAGILSYLYHSYKLNKRRGDLYEAIRSKELGIRTKEHEGHLHLLDVVIKSITNSEKMTLNDKCMEKQEEE